MEGSGKFGINQEIVPSSEFCVSEVEVVEVVDLLLQPQMQEVVEEVEVLVRCQQ
jgi:hypothetical protein